MADEPREARPIRVVVTRDPDDPLALRASVGGGPQVGGYYLVFRGDPQRVVDMLKTVTAAAQQLLPAGRYTDKRGRPQG